MRPNDRQQGMRAHYGRALVGLLAAVALGVAAAAGVVHLREQSRLRNAENSESEELPDAADLEESADGPETATWRTRGLLATRFGDYLERQGLSLKKAFNWIGNADRRCHPTAATTLGDADAAIARQLARARVLGEFSSKNPVASRDVTDESPLAETLEAVLPWLSDAPGPAASRVIDDLLRDVKTPHAALLRHLGLQRELDSVQRELLFEYGTSSRHGVAALESLTARGGELGEKAEELIRALEAAEAEGHPGDIAWRAELLEFVAGLEVDPDRLLPLIASELRSPSWRLRLAAVRAAGDLRGKAAALVDDLAEVLDDNDSRVRPHVARALSRIARHSGEDER